MLSARDFITREGNICRDRARVRFKVDRYVRDTQNVDLRIVGQPEFGFRGWGLEFGGWGALAQWADGPCCVNPSTLKPKP